jgi:uncharacterized protein
MSGGAVLAVTGGHPVDVDAFDEMLSAIGDVTGRPFTHARQPDAQSRLTDGGPWHAVVLHDIVGVGLRRGAIPTSMDPTVEQRTALRSLLDRGQGLVVTHHALASWPTWDGWASAIGGRYLYAPGRLDGQDLACSGYRLAAHTVSVANVGHPVCAGIDPFTVDDELYLCPMVLGGAIPLLVTDAATDGERYRDTVDELLGTTPAGMCGDRGPASLVVGWVTSAGRSPIVYLQPGHSGSTFAHPMYRRLLANAIDWVGSADAHQWAAERNRPLP